MLEVLSGMMVASISDRCRPSEISRLITVGASLSSTMRSISPSVIGVCKAEPVTHFARGPRSYPCLDPIIPCECQQNALVRGQATLQMGY
jgi:hypothetical protein